MDTDLFFAKVHRKLYQWAQPRLMPMQLGALQRRNEQTRDAVVEASGPVVSLTTHGARCDNVHLAIESIAWGWRKPSRLILWLDDARRFNDLPASLRRLQQRGLEIELTDNFGPHTKYYPYVASQPSHDVPLVTADDDIVYPRWWLKRLIAAHAMWPDQICCYRAHVVALSPADGTGDGAILQYSDWPPCESREPQCRHFATGVSGVIYPPSFLDFLRRHGDAFRPCCPKADDIWLHAMALRAGLRVRQLGRLPRHFEVLPGTHQFGLVHSNGFDGGNDRQIAVTYEPADLRKMAGAGE